ncbi:MAG: exodeoxyribonuclease V subunit gamma [Spirochaetes bacterium]|jgi:exodeoxyribonuclease V gamma subunit|nr:exodeoxyribonuclease V subunit gamma [Spirochaetota bacterium]
MSFNVYTSGRLETLAENLSSRVARPLRSPFEKEVMVVMSVGMGRWLSQRLAGRLGVWANFEYVFPTVMIERIFESLAGQGVPGEPFSREVLSWRIMGLLPECARLSGYESLNSYLGDGTNELKRRQLAERIAGVFDQYVVHRPEMVLGWEGGPVPEEDGDERWQADLWRRLFAEKRSVHHAALAARLFAEIDSLTPERLRSLPSRISLFGIATLPPLYVRVLYALSRNVEINFFVLNPSRHYWGDIASAREQVRIARRLKGGIPAADRHLFPGNGLLASMGRVGRDFLFRVLLDADESVDFIDDYPDAVTRDVPTLLAGIQEDIRELIDRGSPVQGDDGMHAERRRIPPGDESISMHSCHSPMREVETLYDYLLDLFEKQPDMEPHDVIIMTPDIETYGPFFEAVFGAPRSEDLRIPYSVADRSLRSENGAAGAFLAILDLYGSRFTAGQVLDIMENDSILARHGMGPSDRETIRRWVEETRIRWGIDAADRCDRAEKLPPMEENTWRHGLDRMVLGSAMTNDEARLFEGILPYDPIEGGDTAVLGGLVGLLEGLFDAARSLALPRTPGEWAGHLLSLIDRFFEEGDDTVGDLASLRRVITRLAEETTQADFSDAVGFPVVRSWLDGSLREEKAHGAFLSGGVTVCAMLPMRSIPFRVICMVGMSDGAYPRRDIEAGFNLMKKAYRPGDRSRRNDDRYIFLEALMSARDRLFISYVGRSITDNKSIPPSVLVSELLDYIEQGYAPVSDDAGSLRSDMLTEHRLQLFSPAYFSGDRKMYSYASELCSAAESFNGEASEYGPFITGETAEGTDTAIQLSDLLDFFQNPARHLLNRTLGIWLDTPGEIPGDSESFALDGLDSYTLAARMVDEALRGADPAGLYEAFRAMGMLPHGSLGEHAFRRMLPGVRSFARAVAGLRGGEKLPPFDLELRIEGRTLAGRIDRVFPGGIVHHRYASIKATDRIRAWIVHCAASCRADAAAHPALYLVGRNNDAPAVIEMKNGGACRAHLKKLAEIYGRGRRTIVPFFPEASLAFAKEYAKSRSVDNALAKARSLFEGNYYVRGDLSDPYTERCFRKMDPFHKDFFKDEFIRLARTVYDPLLKFQEER